MAELLHKTMNTLSALWSGIRQLTGDNAYEHYLEQQKQKGSGDILSREEFYRQRLERKYNNKDSPSRCC